MAQWEVLDISKYQSGLDYTAVANSVDGVIMRLGYRSYSTDGTLVVDNKLADHYLGLLGKTKIGFYWFSTAISDAEAIEEANFCYALIAGQQCDFPVYFDSEMSNSSHTGRSDSLGMTERTQYCLTWCNRMKELGFRPGVYASDSWFKNNLNLQQLKAANVSLWVARYSSNPPSYVTGYDGWQYTSSGSVAGYSGRVDLSHFYNDVAGWGGVTPPQKPTVALPTLRQGDTGTQVAYLQQDLNYVLGEGLAVDGVFGENTYLSLIVFQSYFGLTADGVYGNETYIFMSQLIDGVTPEPEPTPTPPEPTPTVPVDINTFEITVTPTEFTYSGDQNLPAVSVGYLNIGTDFVVSYSNNINAGTGTVTITGINNYTGVAVKQFTINPQSISNKTLIINPSSYNYTGLPIIPNCIIQGLVKDQDFTITSVTDNINKGTGHVTVTGINNYTGYLMSTFTIVGKNIDPSLVNLPIKEYTYTGQEITPVPIVTGLIYGVDYDLSYANNINAGTGTVYVNGIGNYAGSVATKFTINPTSISDKTIVFTSNSSRTYDGTPFEPDISIVGLKEGVDYTKNYVNNINAGTASVVAYGIGNYKDYTNANFTVEPKSIIDFDMEVVDSLYYNANYQEPKIIIDEDLVKNRDYTVRYKNNLQVGIAEVNVNGIGNYKDTKLLTFGIVRRPITMTTVELGEKTSYVDFRINGPLHITLGSYELKEYMDYNIISYTKEPVSTYEVHTINIEGINGFSENFTYVFNVVNSESDIPEDTPEEEDPPTPIDPDDPNPDPYIPQDDYSDDGLYNFGDIDLGDETAKGDYDFGDLDEGVDKDNVAHGNYDFNIFGENFEEGMDFELENTPLYANYNSKECCEYKTGIYYIYKSKVCNGRVRITKTDAAISEPVRSTGWVETRDLIALGKFKIGEAVIANGRLIKYNDIEKHPENEYLDVRNKLMYVVQIDETTNQDYIYGMAYGPTLSRVGWASHDMLTKA